MLNLSAKRYSHGLHDVNAIGPIPDVFDTVRAVIKRCCGQEFQRGETEFLAPQAAAKETALHYGTWAHRMAKRATLSSCVLLARP